VITLATSQFAEFLMRSGAIAGGAIAWGVALGLIGAALATDLGAAVNRWEIAARGGSIGAVFGVTFALAESL
jgi:hypothetical protein